VLHSQAARRVASTSPATLLPIELIHKKRTWKRVCCDSQDKQTTYSWPLVFDSESFYGKLRQLYSDKVLKTQLDQLRKQGSYDAFKLKWNPKYDVGRLHGAKCVVSPPVRDVGRALLTISR
jgi:hypothetical protein